MDVAGGVCWCRRVVGQQRCSELKPAFAKKLDVPVRMLLGVMKASVLSYVPSCRCLAVSVFFADATASCPLSAVIPDGQNSRKLPGMGNTSWFLRPLRDLLPPSRYLWHGSLSASFPEISGKCP